MLSRLIPFVINYQSHCTADQNFVFTKKLIRSHQFIFNFFEHVVQDLNSCSYVLAAAYFIDLAMWQIILGMGCGE